MTGRGEHAGSGSRSGTCPIRSSTILTTTRFGSGTSDGRGDGGAVSTPEGERPYNDLDLFIVTDTAVKFPIPAVQDIRKRYTELLGIAVDVGRPLAVSDLPCLPAHLMWYDMVNGHRVIAGDETVVKSGTAHLVSNDERVLNPVEGSKLLLNRGAGVILACFVAVGNPIPVPEPVDEDFVRRNIMKAYLAIADAVLLSEGGYRPWLSDKLARLSDIANSSSGKRWRLPSLIDSIKLAVAFKRRPDRVTLPGASNEWLRDASGTESQRVEAHSA